MTELFRNSTWQVQTEGLLLPIGIYRILEIWPDSNLIISYKLDSNSLTSRPFKVLFDEFVEAIDGKEILATEYPIPAPKTLSESELPENWRKRRDERYELIRPLVENLTFLRRFVEKKRSTEVVHRARDVGLRSIYLYRILDDYWRYGQTSNALVPMHSNSGGRGRPKRILKGVRGRPKKQPQFGFSARIGRAVTDKDKKQIRCAIKKYYLKGKTKTLSRTYHKYLGKYHFAEMELAAKEKRAPLVPSITQFRYWHCKLSETRKDDQLREGVVLMT